MERTSQVLNEIEGAWPVFRDAVGGAMGLTGVLLSTLFACGCSHAKQDSQQDEIPDSFVGRLVVFEVPNDWLLQRHLMQSNFESFQYFIPDAATEGTPDSANAVVSIETVRDGMDITNLANLRLQATSSPHGYAVLTNMFASDKWCSSLTRAQQDTTPYIVMDRFGVDQGVLARFRVAHPVLSNNAGIVSRSVSNFNRVVSSFKIGGSNAVNSEMRHDHGMVWLRALSDMDTNWMVSPTNKGIYRAPLPRQ